MPDGIDTDHPDRNAYEVADFEPSTGHLHTCVAASDVGWRQDCICAALARDLAENLASRLARAEALCEAWEQEIAFNDGLAPNRPDVDALRAAWKNGGLVPSVDSSPTATAAALVETLPSVGHDG